METFLSNDGIEWVKIETAENQFICMPKAVWDEQQAQKELGGTL